VAGSDLFQKRLLSMAPLRAAAAAHLGLLGRAPTPAESSAFLATRSDRGQLAALEVLMSSSDYAAAFGRDTVPYLRLASLDGIPLPSLNRLAMLYGGNAALNPPTKGAI
jgi:phycobilisome core-membrane linker protein